MPDLVERYRGSPGLGLGHAIIDDLGEKLLPTSPANYEIWAAYKGQTHPALAYDINARLASGQPLSEDFCTELFEVHFAKTRLSAQLVETSAEVAREIADVAVSLKEAGSAAGAYGQDLQEAAGALEQDADAAALRRTIARLVMATKTMEAHNRRLEEKVQTSSRQLESLQNTLQEIRLQAVTDSLTGLANRRYFDQMLEKEVAEANGARPLSLLLADIDHFKCVNDSWGHQVGDQVLRFVASVLKANAGRGLAARYGGEEFAIILPGIALEEAHAVADRVRRAVKAKALTRRSTGESIGVMTASFGVAVYQPGEAIAGFVDRADACLYAAKRAGRDRVTSALAPAPAR